MSKTKQAKAKKIVKPAKVVKTPKPAPKPTVAIAATGSKYPVLEGAGWPARIVRTGGVSPYPFATMKPEAVFFVSAQIDKSKYKTPAEADQAQLEECRRVVNRMSGATRRFSKKNKGFKFSVRTAYSAIELGWSETDNVGIGVRREK